MGIKVVLPESGLSSHVKVFAVDKSGNEIEISGVSEVNINILPGNVVRASVEVIGVDGNFENIDGVVEINNKYELLQCKNH